MLHTNIINISHYCCKLKKLRLVDWRHLKDGIQVYPRCAKGREAGLTFENHPEESRDRYGY